MSQLIIYTLQINVQQQLNQLVKETDAINRAVAFFSNAILIKEWNKLHKKITIIISLRPPTSYYALKDIQTALNTNIYFLGDKFHSKLWLFYKKNIPFAALVGSSNCSDGGLIKNTEA